MLMDKSGLRKKDKTAQEQKSKPNGGGFRQVNKKPRIDREQAIRMAYETGLGYNKYKKEVDALRAAKLRELNSSK